MPHGSELDRGTRCSRGKRVPKLRGASERYLSGSGWSGVGKLHGRHCFSGLIAAKVRLSLFKETDRILQLAKSPRRRKKSSGIYPGLIAQ